MNIKWIYTDYVGMVCGGDRGTGGGIGRSGGGYTALIFANAVSLGIELVLICKLSRASK